MHLALATTLTGIKGTGSPDAEASYLRARELTERLADPIRLYQALWGLWYVNFGHGRFPVALAAQAAIELRLALIGGLRVSGR